MKKRLKPAISLSALTVAAVVAASLTAVSCTVAIFASVYGNSLKQNARVNTEQTVTQAAVAVNNTLDSMRYELDGITELSKNSISKEEFADKISSLLKIKSDIVSVAIYGENGEIIQCTGNSSKNLKNVYKDLSFDKKSFDASPEFSLSKPHVQTLFEGSYPWVVTAAKRADAPVFENGAYIAVDFSFVKLADYIDKVGVGSHGYCYIADNGGNVIYHPQQQMLFSGLKSESTEPAQSLSGGVVTEGKKITAVSSVSDGKWKIIGISYTDEFEDEKTAQIFFSVSIAFLCCFAVCVAVVLIYQRVFNKPVKRLIKDMKEFENSADSFEYKIRNNSVKELTELNNSFAHMSGEIKKLMEKVRNEETQLRKTELKALQAQINPHFLYNTLDSVQWMCEQGKNKDAAAMVSALAKLFRISISRGKELIPIRDELNHAKSYLIIQSYRYRDQFTYSFDTDESLTGYLCNKITLQPLIENAIYHGLDRMVDEGEIKITLKKAGDGSDDILFTVSDNGVGMTEEQCGKILKKEKSDSSGIGVKNVNDRLKIYFGERYGLSIKSELDEGTEVTVKIPRIEESGENK